MAQMRWDGRLKPAVLDPLEAVGFVSKGSTSLLNHLSQQEYFEAIKLRCRSLSSADPALDQGSSDITTPLANLSLNQEVTAYHKDSSSRSLAFGGKPDTMILAMRSLREAIVATSRQDAFSKSVYLFIIRETIILGHSESYHPALQYLIHRIHPMTPLAKDEREESIGYLILDLACRQNDLAMAFHLRRLYDHRSENIDNALSALIHGNWSLFWKAKDAASAYQRRLMSWADGRMMDYALGCLGKSYMSVHEGYVKQCAGLSWEELHELKKTTWERDGEKIVIRQMKKR